MNLELLLLNVIISVAESGILENNTENYLIRRIVVIKTSDHGCLSFISVLFLSWLCYVVTLEFGDLYKRSLTLPRQILGCLSSRQKKLKLVNCRFGDINHI